MEFRERLQLAARHAKVEWSPTAIGKSLTLRKQTVARWMDKGEPSGAMVFLIADRWSVDARWLATGAGEMLAKAPAPAEMHVDEAQLLERYRDADPRWRLSLQLLSAVAVEDQIEAATDVNMVIARIAGMKPSKLRYGTDATMREILKKSPQGWPPRPAGHELRRVQEDPAGYKTGRRDQRKPHPIKKS